MKRLAVLLILVSGLFPGPASAVKEVPADSRISAVTVFPDRALVTRTSEVTVAERKSTIVVSGLPASLIEESLRVEGEGTVKFVIGSLESRRVFREELVREEERHLVKDLTALKDQQRALKDRTKALTVRLRFMETIGQEMPKTANEEIVRGKMTPETWKQAWTTLGTEAAATLAEIQKIEIQERTTTDKILKKEKELSQIRTGRKETIEARIHVETQRADTIRLALSYQVPGASWTPLYAARLDAEGGKVTMIQLSQVRQNTGEDWSDASLTLSTARPAEGAQMPEPEPWFIDFVRIEPVGKTKRARVYGLKDDEMKGMLLQEEMAAPSEIAARPQTAQVVASEFAAEYLIPGASNVPSDNEPHMFTIGAYELNADLAVRSVPKIAPGAYVYAKVEYDGPTPLLPGPVSVFRDGAYIGTSALHLLRPGEALELSFGVDDKLRIQYRLETGVRSKQGIFNKQKRVERRYRIEVENYHSRQVQITVMDQLPVPRDERIKVQLLEDSTKPTERDVEGRKGVLAWTDTYPPEGKRLIRFGYAVNYPEGETVPGF